MDPPARTGRSCCSTPPPALQVAGVAGSWGEGIEAAAAAIDDGRARGVLDRWVAESRAIAGAVVSTALQCPSCGCNHRLESIRDAPVFDCARCGRPLKVPAQYRAGAAAPAAAASAKAGRGPRRAAPKPAARPASRGTTKLPLRILAWIVAFVLGAVVVRTLAKWTGFVGGDTVVNLLIDNKLTTYLRLAALVPAWALFATIFATLILEGPGWWALRSSRRRVGGPDHVAGEAGTGPHACGHRGRGRRGADPSQGPDPGAEDRAARPGHPDPTGPARRGGRGRSRRSIGGRAGRRRVRRSRGPRVSVPGGSPTRHRFVDRERGGAR